MTVFIHSLVSFDCDSFDVATAKGVRWDSWRNLEEKWVAIQKKGPIKQNARERELSWQCNGLVKIRRDSQ
jgi:hypothetical protein